MNIYRLIRPLLFLCPPEAIHAASLQLFHQAARLGCLPSWNISPRALERRFWGLSFPNPVGLAAGFDKNGVALPAWERLGFGFVEIGTVTPRPQKGNAKPRLFRVPREHALVNRMGFPNEGALAIRRRLERLKEEGQWPKIPVGINIGKQKETPIPEAARDYVEVFTHLREVGDFFVLNVSSPNTPELRRLETPEMLLRLLDAVAACHPPRHSPKPVLVKLSPDHTEQELEKLVTLLGEAPCQGIVFCNTSLKTSPDGLRGGWSGAPLKEKATRLLRKIATWASPRLVLIGVGGIESPDDAYERLAAGADLLEIYTGLVYRGPSLARELSLGLWKRGIPARRVPVP